MLETIPIAPSSSKTPHGRGFFSGYRALKIVLFRTTAMIERPIEERRLPLASHGRVINPIRCELLYQNKRADADAILLALQLVQSSTASSVALLALSSNDTITF